MSDEQHAPTLGQWIRGNRAAAPNLSGILRHPTVRAALITLARIYLLVAAAVYVTVAWFVRLTWAVVIVACRLGLGFAAGMTYAAFRLVPGWEARQLRRRWLFHQSRTRRLRLAPPAWPAWGRW